MARGGFQSPLSGPDRQTLPMPKGECPPLAVVALATELPAVVALATELPAYGQLAFVRG